MFELYVCDDFVTVTQYCRASCLTNIYILIRDVLDVLENKQQRGYAVCFLINRM